MSCRIRRAREVPLIPAVDRELSRRTRYGTESTKRAITLLVSGVIFAALLGLAQPVKAEAPDKLPAQVNDEVYAELLGFGQPNAALEPQAIAAAQPTSL